MKKQTRRSFLTTCSASALGAAFPSMFYLQTSAKSDNRPPVVGSGMHTYECVHDWLTPPKDWFGVIHTGFARMSTEISTLGTRSISQACAARRLLSLMRKAGSFEH